MPIYTVHAPVTTNAGVVATDRFTFVRDGFHVWAFVLGPLWLVWRRLWLALIGWIVVAAAVDRGAPPPTRDIPGQPFSKPPASDEIIGLFPQPGASR